MTLSKSAVRFGLTLGIGLAPLAVLAADSTSFVPLANIPALTTAANATDLSAFFNSLYKICIGIAVVLAVLQLIRAGITYMTAAGNIGSVDEAKKLIWQSLLGLLLVLAPVIVFTVINPKILNLSLDTSEITNIPTTTVTNAPDSQSSLDNAACKGSYDQKKEIPSGICKTVLGDGWVSIAQQCCLGNTVPASGSSCCGASNADLKAAAEKAAQETAFKEGTDYYSKAEIPKGNWCYGIKDGNSIDYTCYSTVAKCSDGGGMLSDADHADLVSNCTQY